MSYKTVKMTGFTAHTVQNDKHVRTDLQIVNSRTYKTEKKPYICTTYQMSDDAQPVPAVSVKLNDLTYTYVNKGGSNWERHNPVMKPETATHVTVHAFIADKIVQLNQGAIKDEMGLPRQFLGRQRFSAKPAVN